MVRSVSKVVIIRTIMTNDRIMDHKNWPEIIWKKKHITCTVIPRFIRLIFCEPQTRVIRASFDLGIREFVPFGLIQKKTKQK